VHVDLGVGAAVHADGVGFGSHGKTHAALPTADPTRALEELVASRASLEALLGVPVTVFCYPYGKQSVAVRALARRAGYAAAVMAGRRMNSVSTDPFQLRRLRVDRRWTVARFRWALFRSRWVSWV